MAISLKRYTPQVNVSGEGTAVELSADLAAEAASAGSRVMQSVAEGASELFNKIQEKKDEAEVARLNSEMETDSLAFKQQISEMNDDVEINKFYSSWREKQVEKFNQNNLSRRLLGKAEISFNSYLDKVGIGVQERTFNIVKENADRLYLDLEDAALNGQLQINPSTGELFTSIEEQYDFANKSRVDLGTKTYDSFLSDSRSFEQNRYFKEVQNRVATDINFFELSPQEGGYDASKLSIAQQEEVIRLRGQAENKIISKTIETQTETADQLRAKYDNGLLELPEIQQARIQTVNINGQEIPLISEAQALSLEALVTGRQTTEESTKGYVAIIKKINKLNEESFRMDKVDEILKDLYTVSATGKVSPNFSISTTRSLLDMITKTISGTGAVKEGAFGESQLTPTQREVMKEISSVFDDQTKDAVKEKQVGLGVQRMDGLLQAFYKNVIVGGADPVKWATENLTPYKKHLARQKALMTPAPQSTMFVAGVSSISKLLTYQSNSEIAKDLPSGSIIKVGDKFLIKD